ncbi:MAG: CotH kinase family protein [Chitinophagales bacterium]
MQNNLIAILFSSLLLFSTCTKEEWIFDSPANDNLELPLLLNINGKPCALDIETRTFRYPIDETNIANFEAFIEFQNHSTVRFNDIEFVNNSINNFGDIAVNTAYQVEFTTDGEKNSFHLYFSTLPIIQLINYDRIQDEPKSMARMIINNTSPSKPSENSLIGLEYRGASSLRNPKKSMGLKLIQDFDMSNEHSLPLFDKKPNTRWVLDALYIDEAKARNKVCLDLWQTLPDDNTAHLGASCEYVEVFLNYESLGIYNFCEHLDYEFLSLNSESILITGKDNVPSTYFQALPKNDPSGTYWDSWEQKVPDVNMGHDWEAFEDMCKLVVKGSDEKFTNQIANHIDLDVMIDYFLYVNISKAYDDVGKNWFFMKRSNSEKFVIVPWDFDSTWGRDWTGAKQGYEGVVTNDFYSRLISLNPNNFKGRLKQRWEELKNDELSPNNLITLFDTNFELLNENNIIDIDNQKWDKNVNLYSEREYLNTWIFNNWNYFDNYIVNL